MQQPGTRDEFCGGSVRWRRPAELVTINADSGGNRGSGSEGETCRLGDPGPYPEPGTDLGSLIPGGKPEIRMMPG